MTDDYVTPPKREDEEYVAPPKKNTAASQASNTQEDDYVAPPQHSNAVASSKKSTAKTVEQPKETTQPKKTQKTPPNKTKAKQPKTAAKTNTATPTTTETKRGYFHTPKQSWRFYMTGYLIISFLLYYTNVWSSIKTGWVIKLLWLVYIVLSNYTFSWLSDYFRFKGGVLGWFFTPYGSVKSGMAYASMKSYQTGTVKKTWSGNYKVQSQGSAGRSLLAMIVVTVIVEVLKYMICAPVAFVSLFFHKKTMEHYFEAVNASNQEQ